MVLNLKKAELSPCITIDLYNYTEFLKTDSIFLFM